MKSLLSALVLIPLLLACHKDEDPAFVAGKGGNAVLLLSPKHDANYIGNCKIYLKYNAKSAPSGNNYDDSMICVSYGAKPVAVFTGLKRGDYYIFGEGYDTSVYRNVRGGFGYHIAYDTVNTSLDVPLSE